MLSRLATWRHPALTALEVVGGAKSLWPWRRVTELSMARSGWRAGAAMAAQDMVAGREGGLRGCLHGFHKLFQFNRLCGCWERGVSPEGGKPG